MGHIELAAPVSHIWYFKGIPSRMGLLLDVTPRSLEKVLYFASFIVTDPGETTLEYKQLLSDKEYREAVENFGEGSFEAGMGAEAIKILLQELDLDAVAESLKEDLQSTSRSEAAPARSSAWRSSRPSARSAQQAGVDHSGRRAGHPAGTAPDGSARRRSLCDIRPQRSISPGHQPQQPL